MVNFNIFNRNQKDDDEKEKKPQRTLGHIILYGSMIFIGLTLCNHFLPEATKAVWEQLKDAISFTIDMIIRLLVEIGARINIG